MKFSESWLRQSVNPSISTEELVAQVTMAGLEVDAVESCASKCLVWWWVRYSR